MPQSLPPTLATIILIILSVLRITDACSSRSTPKPRPAVQSLRPNVTFHTYACPVPFSTLYCLNNSTCFTVRIGSDILYNCLCAEGYVGQRCEYKDLDGSYLPSRERVNIETASIAGGVAAAVIIMFVISIVLWIYVRGRSKEQRLDQSAEVLQRTMTFRSTKHGREDIERANAADNPAYSGIGATNVEVRIQHP